MTRKERIIAISQEILDYLLSFKKQHPDFTFALRSRDHFQSKEERLNRGHWFQGGDYIFVPLFKPNDTDRKIKTLGFVISIDNRSNIQRNYIAISFKGDTFSPKEKAFHSELADQLNIELNDKNYGEKQYEHPNQYIKNLHDYLTRIRPIALQLLEAFSLSSKYIIPEKVFQKRLEKIKSIQKRLQEAPLTTFNESVVSYGLVVPINQILYGPPGTGKTYHTINKAISIIENIEEETLEKEERSALTQRFEQYKSEGRIVFTTFHQSMSYEDFVEGIKPQEPENEGDPVIYKIEQGIFKKLCVKAVQSKTPHVLIIDEINRGNISAIFGELITLIEKDKRLGQPEGLELTLPYSKTSFGVPDNVYIIGTMNTADRSVEALDMALRRRFRFIEMPPDSSYLKDKHIGDIHLKEVLDVINQRIEILLDKDHLIGHSYFLKVQTEQHLRVVFAEKIIPLLQEYFYGDYGKIALVLGQGFCTAKFISNVENIFAQVDSYDADAYFEKQIYMIEDTLKEDFDIIAAIELLLNR